MLLRSFKKVKSILLLTAFVLLFVAIVFLDGIPVPQKYLGNQHQNVCAGAWIMARTFLSTPGTVTNMLMDIAK